uniref:Thioredoxin H-type (Fragments) n=1 Tax=Populus euphratica TaxID=75702 RepID=TRXH_POPEU|nr:RecName: Full=Thioredoxin H-type; Short=Trx-H [Populus euphratica]
MIAPIFAELAKTVGADKDGLPTLVAK